MANAEHLETLKRGVKVWNVWRQENRFVLLDLTDANLSYASLDGADLSGADLSGADLSGANLSGADLSAAELFGANLSDADLSDAYIFGANLSAANLSYAFINDANLNAADLSDAYLSYANLSGASLLHTIMQNAILSNCVIFGISVWDIKGEIKEQRDLIITPPDQPIVTVDNIKVAQFIYLLLNNQEIRDVIDTLTAKAVLILGRFTDERKKVLDSLKDKLRDRGYLPILFDFEKPGSRNLTETIKTLAGISRFVIADITDAKSIIQELMAIVPHYPSIPVQPLLLADQEAYAMFESFRPYPWVCDAYRYDSLEMLLANLEVEVIGPAERRVVELKGKG